MGPEEKNSLTQIIIREKLIIDKASLQAKIGFYVTIFGAFLFAVNPDLKDLVPKLIYYTLEYGSLGIGVAGFSLSIYKINSATNRLHDCILGDSSQE